MQRRNPPDAGLWGYPGGRIEAGETIIEAALRELAEETGIAAQPRALLPPIEVLRHDAGGRLSAHFILLPVLCEWRAGAAVAASDALDAAWFSIGELAARPALLSENVLDLAMRSTRCITSCWTTSRYTT